MKNKSLLAQIREQAGFATVEAASGQVGYHPVYLAALEAGRARLSGNALVKLAKGYRMTVEQLEHRINGAKHGRHKGNGSRKLAAAGAQR